ncbi:MAG: hypothetical protein HGA85_06410 [Nanoarchaeota archaeon]|nr:hypothetical protein [Nanoarchaeota archaeon]
MNEDSLLPNSMENMKKDLDFLKRRMPEPENDKDNLRESVESLSRSMGTMMKIFKEASADMKMDTHDAVLVSQRLDKILDRLDKIETQNEKIAKGIVAIADMIEELQRSSAQPARPSYQQPMMPIQPQMPQRDQNVMSPGNMMSQGIEAKPLPTYNLPREEERKKAFSFKI